MNPQDPRGPRAADGAEQKRPLHVPRQMVRLLLLDLLLLLPPPLVVVLLLLSAAAFASAPAAMPDKPEQARVR